jgi:hypothetical protein
MRVSTGLAPSRSRGPHHIAGNRGRAALALKEYLGTPAQGGLLMPTHTPMSTATVPRDIPGVMASHLKAFGS